MYSSTSSNLPKVIDLDFIYADCDTHANEISEFYSYTEEDDFLENRSCFENLMKELNLPIKFSELNDKQRNFVIDKLANTIELSNKQERTKSVRSTLYLLQGLFGECVQLNDQRQWTNELVIKLYKKEFFQMFVQLLLIETDLPFFNSFQCEQTKNLKDSKGSNFDLCYFRNLITKFNLNLFFSLTDLRLILNGLYVFVEVMFRENEQDTEDVIKIKKQFKDELSSPLPQTKELFAITLFGMITRFCNGKAPHFPIKKILLLLWKTLLLTLGGIDELRRLKKKYRDDANLKEFKEDSLEVIKRMRSSTPPPEEGRKQDKFLINKMAFKKNSFKRQVSILNFPDKGGEEVNDESINDEVINDETNTDQTDETDGSMMGLDDEVSDYDDSTLKKSSEEEKAGDEEKDSSEEDPNEDLKQPTDEDNNKESEGLDMIIKEIVEDMFNNQQGAASTANNQANKNENNNNNNETPNTPAPERPGSPRPLMNMEELWPNFGKVNPNVNKEDIMQSSQVSFINKNKSLPWTPKVRVKDIDLFFEQVRRKNIGFSLPNNRTTTAGLPALTLESIRILNQYLYVSLAEQQVQREEELILYPLTCKELNPSSLESPAEFLYKEMLPSLPQYMIALLKILFASLPTSKNKTEVFNVMGEVILGEENTNFIETMKYMIDSSRHKEIIIKAVSSILLLILKHYKINHIYQFEYISQQLMLANCIPLILKFFNQNVLEYITSKNTISVIDFPACVIGQQAELTTEILEMGYADTPYCWRNLLSSINLLRILNKLIKWKEARIQALNFFKAYPILRKSLIVRHPMMQLYVLKLIKMQVRHFGRQLRKTNIQIISIIYQKVRHRFTDDWVYSNTAGNKPTIMNNFQKEELNLQAKIKGFHIRRYNNKDLFGDIDYSPTATNANLNGYDNFSMFIGLSNEENLDEILLSTTDSEIHLTDQFKDNYEGWLQRNVFGNKIDWDQVLIKLDESSDFD